MTAGRTIKELNTRFLFPFFFHRHSVLEAAILLEAATFAGVAPGWMRAGRPGLYTDEMLEHVAGHLFPKELSSGGGGYLHLAETAANKVFRSLSVSVREGRALPVSLSWAGGVELFLSPQGVGLLSVTLQPGEKALETEAAIDFNYSIARRHGDMTARFRMSHPQDDAGRWSHVPEESRSKIGPIPADDAPFEGRIARPGGTFTLSELANALLAPIVGLAVPPGDEKAANAKSRRIGIQEGFSVYTVALFGTEVDFDDSECRLALAPVLSSLAQVEEASHAGHSSVGDSIPAVVLNRKHWAASGQLATAHLIADQPVRDSGKEPPFNLQRMGRIRDKYFATYAAAYLQRLALQRAMHDAVAIIGAGGTPGTEAAMAFAALRSDLLDFAVLGHFTQVSGRQAVHRTYQLALEGMDVARSWEDVRRAVADIDARNAAHAQEAMTKGMARSLTQGVQLQKAVHLIEIFLVTVYSAHLSQMLLEELKPIVKGHEPWEHTFHLASPFLVIGAALAGFLATRAFVHRHDSDAKAEEKS